MDINNFKYFDANDARNKSDSYVNKKKDELIDYVFAYGIIPAVNGGEYSCSVVVDIHMYPQQVRDITEHELKKLDYKTSWSTYIESGDKLRLTIKWNET